MKNYHFLPVFLVLVASYVGLHYYSARWLARAFALAEQPAALLRLFFLLAAFTSPFTMFLRRLWNVPALEPVYAAAFAWMGVILLAAFAFGCADLAAWLLRRGGLAWGRTHDLATLACLAAVLAWAFWSGARTPELREITLPVKDLPPSLEGLRIAQVSDMHVDSKLMLRRFEAVAARISAAQPDLVVFTGDLLDPGIDCAGRMDAVADGIRARLGSYGVPGNHEYYYGLEQAMGCYRAFGIKPLVDSAADIGDLRIVGLGDIHTAHMSREDVLAKLRELGTGKTTLLLCHQPLFFDQVAAQGDYIMLSGHTHRGQIFPFHIFTKLFYPHFYGLYRATGSFLYVTSGSGTWGPPLRWLAPAEIPLITLKRA